MTTTRLLARNSALNLFGQITPIAVALLTIPFLIHGYGAERFGVLALAQAAIGYFSLFDLGLGRALTQSVAQRLGNGGEDELPAVVRTGLAMLFVLGVAAAIILAALTPALSTRILRIPAELQDETKVVFFIMAATLPFVLATTGLRALMEAHQHFGLATSLRLPSGLITYVGPLVVLPFSRSLVPAVSVMAAGRVVICAAHWLVARRTYAYTAQRGVLLRESMSTLLRFGAWMTVTNLVSPLMVYVDRFIIGAALGLAAVTAYVTPYEAVVKLLIIPGALTGAAMPALAATLASDPQRMMELYQKSFRAVILIMFPIVLTAVVLAREALSLWVGPALPQESSVVLQWLAVGVFTTALAFPPMTALHSAGRPDLLAKLHLLELPIYFAAIFLLMRALGIQGIAIAWTMRTTLDAIATTWLARRALGVPVVPVRGGFWLLAVMLVSMAAGAALTSSTGRAVYSVAIVLIFTAIAWRRLMTPAERRGLCGWITGANAGGVAPSVDA